jgi:hypothetical protein
LTDIEGYWIRLNKVAVLFFWGSRDVQNNNEGWLESAAQFQRPPIPPAPTEEESLKLEGKPDRRFVVRGFTTTPRSD